MGKHLGEPVWGICAGIIHTRLLVGVCASGVSIYLCIMHVRAHTCLTTPLTAFLAPITQISGPLPPSMSQLSELRELYINYTEIEGRSLGTSSLVTLAVNMLLGYFAETFLTTNALFRFTTAPKSDAHARVFYVRACVQTVRVRLVLSQ